MYRLFHHASQPDKVEPPSARNAEPETQQAEAFSESEAEDEESNSDAMDKFLNA